jgi:hypothetical protein
MSEIAEGPKYRRLSARGVSDEQHGAYGCIRCPGICIDGRGADGSQLPIHIGGLILEGDKPSTQ